MGNKGAGPKRSATLENKRRREKNRATNQEGREKTRGGRRREDPKGRKGGPAEANPSGVRGRKGDRGRGGPEGGDRGWKHGNGERAVARESGERAGVDA